MIANFQLRADETILFQGDVNLVKSLVSVKQGQGVVTGQRCMFAWDGAEFVAEKSQVVSAEEQKYGLGTKLLLQHTSGQSVTVQAVNMRGLKHALYALAGLPSDPTALKQPELTTVKNTTAWLAALSPLWADFVVMLLGSVMGWDWDKTTGVQLLKILLLKLAVIYMFMRIDHLRLQQLGFNTAALGITAPEKLPLYLFGRAKAFGHRKFYAITWCVLVAWELLLLL